MKNNNFIITILLLVITVFLGFWVFSGGEKKTVDEPVQSVNQDNVDKNASVANNRAVSNKKADDSTKPLAKSVAADDSELPILYGTMVTKNNKSAIFKDPSTDSTGMYRIDDSVAGFLILDIYKDKVILLRGSEEIEVYLRDQKDIATNQLPTVERASTTEVSSTKIPLRPIPPTRAGDKPIPGMEDLTSEEMVPPEGFATGLKPTHERFDRRPIHEDLTTPIHPPPPIPPTYDD